MASFIICIIGRRKAEWQFVLLPYARRDSQLYIELNSPIDREIIEFYGNNITGEDLLAATIRQEIKQLEHNIDNRENKR